jgi:hypothetical protein
MMMWFMDNGDIARGRVPVVANDRALALNIIKSIEKGHTISIAASHGGVSRRTVHNWLQHGKEAVLAREADPPTELTPYDDDYMWFYFEYEKAGAIAREFLLDRIIEAGEKSWQASAWVLERRWPEEFSTRRQIEVKHTKRENRHVSINIGGRPALVDAAETLAIEESIQEADFEIIE